MNKPEEDLCSPKAYILASSGLLRKIHGYVKNVGISLMDFQVVWGFITSQLSQHVTSDDNHEWLMSIFCTLASLALTEALVLFFPLEPVCPCGQVA